MAGKTVQMPQMRCGAVSSGCHPYSLRKAVLNYIYHHSFNLKSYFTMKGSFKSFLYLTSYIVWGKVTNEVRIKSCNDKLG